MATLLRIDASAQSEERSLTRNLTGLFEENFLKHAPGSDVIVRDVGHNPFPAIDQQFIHAAFTPFKERETWMHERLKLSDQLIDELDRADVITLGVPMYNYGIPAPLKCWIDHVARIDRTFSFDLSRGDYPIEPILSGKKLVVLSSRGEFGFHAGGVRSHMNALDPAIAACAHYLGANAAEIQTVAIEYQEFKDTRHQRSVELAEKATREIAMQLALPKLAA
ncbi:FMN-dependent NADH-azoreductase [Parasedimentitalea maritima]|uniref:FMN dependent NADH:quinone oxidoreductase n=1 Tax=Parasedimentitalea maritima TaxID=2578117 RepID=A0A6A4RFF5_9RHOB|nr:NAD(P)H-dependent oxidoreductase [Zongyanglinia marina]KAE9628643.1 FMN-dependent NADH-azoreductase [Zongyanglinia marina]